MSVAIQPNCAKPSTQLTTGRPLSLPMGENIGATPRLNSHEPNLKLSSSEKVSSGEVELVWAQAGATDNTSTEVIMRRKAVATFCMPRDYMGVAYCGQKNIISFA